MSNLQKWGGIAALGHAAVYLMALALGVTLMLCAQHGRWLGGGRPLRRLIAPTAS